MRVPLKESVRKNNSGFNEIDISLIQYHGRKLRWEIYDSQLNPVERVIYWYTVGNGKNNSDRIYNDDGSLAKISLNKDKNKFYENGLIYNADGSVSDNKLVYKFYYFHDFFHASLNRLLEKPVAGSQYHRFQAHRLYGLPVGDNKNLRRIVEVRDRLNVPDWVALLVFIELVDEDNVRALLVEVPDLFAYPSEWILRLLGVSADAIKAFCTLNDGPKLVGYKNDVDYFANFCEIVKLETSALKVGEV